MTRRTWPSRPGCCSTRPTAPPGDDAGRVGFWFDLGLSDPRVRLFRWFSFGLHDPADGRTARVDRERLVGDPGLLDDLERRHREWLDLGAPSSGGSGSASPDATRMATREDAAPTHTRERDAAGPTWSLPGRPYRRIVTLA